MAPHSGRILTINSGSSSLKFGIYEDGSLLFTGSIDSIGNSNGTLKLKDAQGKTLVEKSSAAKSQDKAFKNAIEALEQAGAKTPNAIGHRIVHGGPKLRRHQRLTPEVLAILKQAVHFAPLHDPPAITLIEAAQQHFEGVPQFACFDTAFHTSIPEVAAHYPLPAKYYEQGVLRYGFHGLSYESIVHTLGKDLSPHTVVAHLGSGASLCAMLNGKSVDTSMGLTPTGGIPMGTRSGDLDPSIVLWLLRSGINIDAVENLLNHDSGLKALSNGVSDMRELTKSKEPTDALAIQIFTRAIAKTIAAYAVSLCGLDALVFTGGIGEHSSSIREKVCAQLAFLSITIDPASNASAKPIVSTNDSAVIIRVVETDEDAQIARHTGALLGES